MSKMINKYKLSRNGVQRSDGMCIPEDLDNRHWQEYIKWLDEGNTPSPRFTQDEIDTKALEEEIHGLKKALRTSNVFYLRIIVELFQLLKQFTDCTNADMRPGLLTKLQNLKTRTDRLKEIDE